MNYYLLSCWRSPFPKTWFIRWRLGLSNILGVYRSEMGVQTTNRNGDMMGYQVQVNVAVDDWQKAKETGDEQKVKEAKEEVKEAEAKVEKAKKEVEKAEEKVKQAKKEVNEAEEKVKAQQEKAIRCTASVWSQFSRKMQK